VLLIDQAMEVLVHVKALIVVRELLVWIVALLAKKEGPVGIPTLLAEVHILVGWMVNTSSPSWKTIPPCLFRNLAWASRSGLPHDGILPMILRPAPECTGRLSSHHKSISINCIAIEIICTSNMHVQ
jgi:hypothetical protein